MCINDSDISPDIGSPPVELRGFTDMSFSVMTKDALVCWRKLTHVPVDSEGQAMTKKQNWTDRYRIVQDWEQGLQERHLQYCDTSQPLQLFTRMVGEGMIVTMQLLMRRPLYGFISSGPPPADDYDTLKVATDVLDVSLLKQTNHVLDPWGWHIWAKWYALAVALANLCSGCQEEQVDRAWSVVEASFPQVMETVVDDVLKRSLEKLMTKARSARCNSRAPSYPRQPKNSEEIPPMVTASMTAKPNVQEPLSSVHFPRFEAQPLHQHSYNTMQGLDGLAQSASHTFMPSPKDMMLDGRMDESNVMSWENWELFVQDFSASNELETLDLALWE